jgi:hypothetical protein
MPPASHLHRWLRRLADLAGSDHPSADWLVGKLTTPWG